METYVLNVGENKRRGIPIACAQSFVSFSRSWHRSLVSAEVCMWLGPSHRQAKDNEKNSGVDGSLTYCGDAQKESENKA